MSTSALLAAAADATAALKAAATAHREDEDRLFAESALATAAFVKARGSASRLADINKERKSGYGSLAAVQYHALTGRILALPLGDYEGTAKSVQTKVKAVYQGGEGGAEKARAIITKAKTVDEAVAALAAAKPETSLADILNTARKALEDAAELRSSGAAFDQDAQDVVAVITAALNVIVTPRTVTVSESEVTVAA